MAVSKPRVVLDTNVLVSAGIRVDSYPYRIVDAVLSGKLDAFHCETTEDEANNVILRVRFKRYGFPPVWLRSYFRFSHRVPTPVDNMIPALPDQSDTVFLALALQQGALLVTGNIKDYPEALRAGVSVLTPREFVERFAAIFHEEEDLAIDVKVFLEDDEA